MDASDDDREKAVQERAYYMWEAEGRPEGRAERHWQAAQGDQAEPLAHHHDGLEADEQGILDGDPSANFPALLTRDVRGG